MPELATDMPGIRQPVETWEVNARAEQARPGLRGPQRARPQGEGFVTLSARDRNARLGIRSAGLEGATLVASVPSASESPEGKPVRCAATARAEIGAIMHAPGQARRDPCEIASRPKVARDGVRDGIPGDHFRHGAPAPLEEPQGAAFARVAAPKATAQVSAPSATGSPWIRSNLP